jgi:hypothetical protein
MTISSLKPEPGADLATEAPVANFWEKTFEADLRSMPFNGYY